LKLSIIIPCYNEEDTLKPLLDDLFKVKFPIKREIIIVDDGSSKNHREFIEEEIAQKKVTFIKLPKNQGKGIAIRIGLRYAKGDVFVIQDADFEYFPSDIPKLLKPILNNEANAVYGTRFSVIPKNMYKSHFLGNILLTRLTNFLYAVHLTDMETGYKIFTKKILEKLSLNAREFEFEPELTAKIILNGYRIKEIPIKYHYRDFGYAKINWLDGIESVLILLQNRFFINSKIFHFLYNIFKFHFKTIGSKLLDSIFNKFRIRV